MAGIRLNSKQPHNSGRVEWKEDSRAQCSGERKQKGPFCPQPDEAMFFPGVGPFVVRQPARKKSAAESCECRHYSNKIWSDWLTDATWWKAVKINMEISLRSVTTGLDDDLWPNLVLK